MVNDPVGGEPESREGVMVGKGVGRGRTSPGPGGRTLGLEACDVPASL